MVITEPKPELLPGGTRAIQYGPGLVEMASVEARKGWEMNFTTKEKDELAVVKREDKEGPFVELDTRGALVFLTPKEAVRLGNALIKAAQSRKQKEEAK